MAGIVFGGFIEAVDLYQQRGSDAGGAGSGRGAGFFGTAEDVHDGFTVAVCDEEVLTGVFLGEVFDDFDVACPGCLVEDGGFDIRVVGDLILRHSVPRFLSCRRKSCPLNLSCPWSDTMAIRSLAWSCAVLMDMFVSC